MERIEVRELRQHASRYLDRDGRLVPARGPRVLPEPVDTSGPSTAEVLDELRADRL